MKTVVLVRHSKSSWDAPGVPDFERPLNERGKRDAPDMARRLQQRGIVIDTFISSPAKRAKRTATIFAETLGANKEDIISVPELYHAGPLELLAAIHSAPVTASVIAIFGHNPGITELANQLTEVRLDNMPTSAVFSVQADINSWTDFTRAHKKFLFFDYPKATAE